MFVCVTVGEWGEAAIPETWIVPGIDDVAPNEDLVIEFNTVDKSLIKGTESYFMRS